MSAARRRASPAALASFDAMAAEARRLWDGSALRYVFVRNPGDAKSVMQIGRLDEGMRQQHLRRGLFRRADRRADAAIAPAQRPS